MNKNTIYCIDAMDGLRQLEDESIDLIVTDPPYKTTSRGNAGGLGGYFKNKDTLKGTMFKDNKIEISEWLPEIYRVLKESGHCYIMTNNKNIVHYLNVIDKSQFHFIKNLIWVKQNKIVGNAYMSQYEYVIMLRKGRHKFINHCGTSDVLQVPLQKLKDNNNKPLHVTEKPVELTNILIRNSSNEGDTILDPFAGIGGSCVSAKLLKRHYIGFEINEHYQKIAMKRVIDCE